MGHVRSAPRDFGFELLLLSHIDHLERTITMLMDEGNVYQQGRDAAKAEWADERKELVEMLGPLCDAERFPHGLHNKDCRLAKAIGAKTKEN